MKITFVFTKNGEKALLKMPKADQDRICARLKELKTHSDIFSVPGKPVNFEPATHRLRIGRYLLILELRKSSDQKAESLVLDVGHRKDIYR